MTDRSTVQQAIYDEFADVMAQRSDTPSKPDVEGHVVLDEPDLREQTPALSLRWLERDQMDGRYDVRVSSIVRNDAGEVIDIEYAEELTLEVEVACIAKTDVTAVDVYEDVRQRFTAYQRVLGTDQLHPAVDDVDCRDASPTSGDDRRAHILRIDISYNSTYLYSDVTGSQIVPARQVEQTVEGETKTTD
jgi:hypothetical protein